ncbi:hypothetical protein QKW55_02015 [Bacillus paralicheniformis]|nr:hypothetical protein [Bacillus paralicheniformis]WEZ22775.1 hypothetical protein P5637_15125 [Bacillus paralicheniformis]WHH55166.1 hypothetical protein QKW55_02015 [Bacillus paralicheniformis]
MKRKLMTLGLTAVLGSSAVLIPLKSNHALAYEDLEKKRATFKAKNLKTSQNSKKRNRSFQSLNQKKQA